MRRLTILTVLLIFSFLFSSCEKDSIINKSQEGFQENDQIELPEKSNTDLTLFTETTLFADQTIEAGTVYISLSEDNLLVTYTTINGFELEETHVWIGTDLGDMPQTNTGNPKVGHFPYKDEGLSGTNYQYVIPVSDLGTLPDICGTKFLVAAHASLVQYDDNGNVIRHSGAWADGEQINAGGSWATVFSFNFECGNPPLTDCETTFALGDLTFIDAGLTDDMWGWIITIEKDGTNTACLYAGAENNIIEDGYYVGIVKYSLYNGVLSIDYKIFDEYVMDETNVYAANQFPETIIPEAYGYHHDLDNAQNDYYRVYVEHGTVYLILHAVVCPNPEI